MKTKTKKSRFQIMEKSVFIIVFALFMLYTLMLLYPMLWGLLSSFKTINLYFDDPFALPDTWQFKNYVAAFEQISAGDTTFLDMLWNSTWFSVGSAWISVETIAFNAYVINKYKFRGRNFLFALVLFVVTVPLGASFVSTYRLMYALKITNSYLILVTAIIAYNSTFLFMHSFFSGISWAYAEAAQIDGANFYQIYFKAMRPQASSIMVTFFILGFIGKWNDYMSPLLFLPKMPTLATGLFAYQTIVLRSGNYPVLFAGLMISLVPVMIIFAIFQDRLMGGFSIGGLKG